MCHKNWYNLQKIKQKSELYYEFKMTTVQHYSVSTPFMKYFVPSKAEEFTSTISVPKDNCKMSSKLILLQHKNMKRTRTKFRQVQSLTRCQNFASNFLILPIFLVILALSGRICKTHKMPMFSLYPQNIYRSVVITLYLHNILIHIC